VSQPSLTRAIKKLEDELGGELFRRERSRTHLSDLGRAMQPLLQQSLDSALAAKAQAASYGRSEMASLKIGISATIEVNLVLPALLELTKVMENLQLSLIRKPASELVKSLENGEIELCISALEDMMWDRIHKWPLFSEELVALIAKSSEVEKGQSLVLSQLSKFHVISHTGCEHGGAFQDTLEKQGVQVGGFHETSDQSDINAIVGSGVGIGIAPKSIRLPEGVAALPIEGLDLSRIVSLSAVSGRQYSTAASSFIRLLRAADWSNWETQLS